MPALELTVTMAGASVLSSLRERGVPYPVAMMTALQVAIAACLAFAIAGGSDG